MSTSEPEPDTPCGLDLLPGEVILTTIAGFTVFTRFEAGAPYWVYDPVRNEALRPYSLLRNKRAPQAVVSEILAFVEAHKTLTQ